MAIRPFLSMAAFRLLSLSLLPRALLAEVLFDNGELPQAGNFSSSDGLPHFEPEFGRADAVPSSSGTTRILDACPAKVSDRSAPAVGQDAKSLSQLTTKALSGQVLGFFDSQGTYRQTACNASDVRQCANCAQLDASGHCAKCRSGHILAEAIDGASTCVECDDAYGWRDAYGQTCDHYAANAAKRCKNAVDPNFPERLPPTKACCACGGGDFRASPFRHALSGRALALEEEVSAAPVPQVASLYMLDKMCALGSFGLVFDNRTGRISGRASRTGRVECHVFAIQDPSKMLMHRAELSFTVMDFSFGQKTLTLGLDDNGLLQMDPVVEPRCAQGGRAVNCGFISVSHTCEPRVSWLEVLSSGALRYVPASSVASLWGLDASHCVLIAMRPGDVSEHRAEVTLNRVHLWSGVHYNHRSSTAGGKLMEPSPMQRLHTPGSLLEASDAVGVSQEGEETGKEGSVAAGAAAAADAPALRPDILDVHCKASRADGREPKSGEALPHWSRSSGLVTAAGQALFFLDPESGDVSGAAGGQVLLADGQEQLGGRAALSVRCSVAAGGEQYGKVLSSFVEVEVKDDTCWAPTGCWSTGIFEGQSWEPTCQLGFGPYKGWAAAFDACENFGNACVGVTFAQTSAGAAFYLACQSARLVKKPGSKSWIKSCLDKKTATLRTTKEDLCLQRSRADVSGVELYGCNDGRRQKWELEGGLLRSLFDGQCLTRRGGGSSVLQASLTQSHRRPIMRTEHAELAADEVSDAQFTQVAAHLDLTMSPCEFQRSNATPSYDKQKWSFVEGRLQSGDMEATNRGICLHSVPGASRVVASPCESEEEEEWQFRWSDPMQSLITEGSSDKKCSEQCKDRADCSSYWIQETLPEDCEGGQCTLQKTCMLQTSSSEEGEFKLPQVKHRKTKCAEQTSCIKLDIAGMEYLSGTYCPQGLDVKSAPFYTREGDTLEDQVWLAREGCALNGSSPLSSWAIRRPASDGSDQQDASSKQLRLNGPTLACLNLDFGSVLLNAGFSYGSVDLSTDLEESPTKPQSVLKTAHAFAKPQPRHCSVPAQLLGQGWSIGGLGEDFGSHTLDPCECFGEDMSAKVKSIAMVDVEDSDEFNLFRPKPQQLFSGPYMCEHEGVIPGSQSNDVNEVDCLASCMQSFEDGCRFYMYTPSLRFCVLLTQCTRISDTGAGIDRQLFGVFPKGDTYCRVNDAERCWDQVKRRELLTGSESTNNACAFEDVLKKCDALQMISAETTGVCGRCLFFRSDTKAAEGLKKLPLPDRFEAGATLSVACAAKHVLLRRSTGKTPQAGWEGLSCVDGAWIDSTGHQGTEDLECSPCVQVSQRSFAKLDRGGMPEAFFISKRKLQFHYGYISEGCMRTSERGAAPLRSGNKCLTSYGMETCTKHVQKWFFYGDMLKLKQEGSASTLCLTVNDQTVVTGKCEGWVSQRWVLHGQNLRMGDRCLSSARQMVPCDEGSESQAWYFDGGDCMMELEPKNSKTPLRWNAKVGGYGFIGHKVKETRLHTLTDVASDSKVGDPTLGVCAASLDGSLKDAELVTMAPELGLKRAEEAIDAQTGKEKGAGNFSNSFVFGTQGRAFFTCAPGKHDRATLMDLSKKVNAKQAEQKELRESCIPVTYTSKERAIHAGEFVRERGSGRVECPGNKAISDIFSKKDGHARRWKAVCSEFSGGATLVNCHWGSFTDPWNNAGRSCGNGEVMTGIWVTYEQGSQNSFTAFWDRLFGKGNHREDQRFKIKCCKMTHIQGPPKEKGYANWANRLREDYNYDPPHGWLYSGLDSQRNNDVRDRTYRPRGVGFCQDRSEEVAKSKAEETKLKDNIREISASWTPCAQDLPMGRGDIETLVISYTNHAKKDDTALQISVKCTQLELGDEAPDDPAFSISNAELAADMRDRIYKITLGSDPLGEPFFAKRMSTAIRAGYYAPLEHGATLWSIECERGSVVVAQENVASPYCMFVGATETESDKEISSSLPNSAVCPLGMAVYGWYNALNILVSEGPAGGPSSPTPFSIKCRRIVGLSRTCEEREGNCQKDEVVSGLKYVPGESLSYQCCRVPKPIGVQFYGTELSRISDWEGYYCPTHTDMTGRHVYKMQEDYQQSPVNHSTLSFNKERAEWQLVDDSKGFIGAIPSLEPMPYDLPRDYKFSASKINALSAGYMSDSGARESLSDKRPPSKPQLSTFEAQQPKLDQFCRGTGSLLDRHVGPQYSRKPEAGMMHPCFFTYQHKITEVMVRGCEARVGGRSYMDERIRAAQVALEAKLKSIQMAFKYIALGSEIVAGGLAAIAPGSFADPAHDGADQVAESAEDAVDGVTEVVEDEVATNAKEGLMEHIMETVKKELMLAAKGNSSVVNKITAFAMAHEEAKAYEENALNLAFPKDLLSPDGKGYAYSKNLDKMAKAGWDDCDAVTYGFSKIMCDLYCTEDAVRAGNDANAKNIRKATNVINQNMQKLLDYHTELVVHKLGDEKSKQAALINKRADVLPEHAESLGEGTGQHGDAGSVPEAMAAARAEMLLVLSPPDSLNGTLPIGYAEWYQRSGDGFLLQVRDALGVADNSTWHENDNASFVIDQSVGRMAHVAELLGAFRADAVGRLRAGGTARVGNIARAKAAEQQTLAATSLTRLQRLRNLLSTHEERLDAAYWAPSASSVPSEGGNSASTLSQSPFHGHDGRGGREVADVELLWNGVVDTLVHAHERHNLYREQKRRAHGAMRRAMDFVASFLECAADTSEMQDEWQSAMRLEEAAGSTLLEAWASTVAAQERMRMLFDGGLVQKMAGASVQAFVRMSPSCNATLDLLRAHQHVSSAVDTILWHVSEHVLALENLANFQEAELKLTKLEGVAPFDMRPIPSELERVAEAAGDARHPLTKGFLATALDTSTGSCAQSMPCRGGGWILLEDSECSRSLTKIPYQRSAVASFWALVSDGAEGRRWRLKGSNRTMSTEEMIGNALDSHGGVPMRDEGNSVLK